MSHIQRVYIPPRIAWRGVIDRNPVEQLDHAGRIEDVDVESYSSRGVTGWTLHRANGESVLVVSKRTSANPFEAVLCIPGITSLPIIREEAKGYRWIYPKTTTIDASFDIPAICTETRVSWENAFAFYEEAECVK